MKIHVFSLLFFMIAANVVSAQSISDKWPAIKDLNSVISQTFRAAEEGNLVPVKARSKELYDKSAALLKTNIPAEYRTKSILAAADKLQMKAKEINQLIMSKAGNAEIVSALADLRDIFHDIAGMYPDEKK